MKRRRLDRDDGNWLRDIGDVNPMEGLSNLSDVMLCLAVGIMLALVMAWNVDIASTSPAAAETAGASVQGASMTDDVSTISSGDLQSGSGDGTGLSEYGTVYVDADGNFYVVEDGASASSGG